MSCSDSVTLWLCVGIVFVAVCAVDSQQCLTVALSHTSFSTFDLRLGHTVLGNDTETNWD